MIDRAKKGGKNGYRSECKQRGIAVFERKMKKKESLFVRFFLYFFELLRRATAVKVKLSVTTPFFSFFCSLRAVSGKEKAGRRSRGDGEQLEKKKKKLFGQCRTVVYCWIKGDGPLLPHLHKSKQE